MANFIRTLARQPRQLALRRWLFQIHLWTGIGAGLYVFAMSLSGSALVFRQELQGIFPGAARAVKPNGPRAALEDVKSLVAKRFPAYRVAWIHRPEGEDLAFDVWFEKGDDARLAFVDPYGPRFITEVGPTTTFWTFLQDLHFYLFAGTTGLLINGIGGLLLGLLCLTGIVIWWPGRTDWKRALLINFKAKWKRFNWDLHSAGGMWILAFVAVWAITGAYFAFPQPFVKAVEAMFAVTPEVPSPAPPKNTRTIPVDTLVARALEAVPGHRPTWIGLPHHEGENLAMVYLSPGSSEDPHEVTYVYLNPFNAEILAIRRPEDAKPGDRVLSWFASLHFGNFGGWPVKAIWAVLGLSPAILFVTGFLMWWNRVVGKKWRRRQSPGDVSEPEAELMRG